MFGFFKKKKDKELENLKDKLEALCNELEDQVHKAYHADEISEEDANNLLEVIDEVTEVL